MYTDALTTLQGIQGNACTLCTQTRVKADVHMFLQVYLTQHSHGLVDKSRGKTGQKMLYGTRLRHDSLCLYQELVINVGFLTIKPFTPFAP